MALERLTLNGNKFLDSKKNVVNVKPIGKPILVEAWASDFNRNLSYDIFNERNIPSGANAFLVGNARSYDKPNSNIIYLVSPVQYYEILIES